MLQYTILENPDNPYRLGRNVKHDPRSRNFRLQPATTINSSYYARNVPIFDQGNLGSCTGNAAAGSIATNSLGQMGLTHVATTLGGPTALIDEAVAIDIYSQATQLDPYQDAYPPFDTGSDGLSVAKVLQRAGIIAEYTHGFGLSDLLSALQTGPAIVGTNWYSSMFNPTFSGLVNISANSSIEGGHEYCAVGLDTSARQIRFANSWGDSWGDRGYFLIGYDTMDRLLNEDGDTTVFRPKGLLPEPPPLPACSWIQIMLRMLSLGLVKPKCR